MSEVVIKMRREVDVVDRLKKHYSPDSHWSHGSVVTVLDVRDAVEEIERLRKEIETTAQKNQQAVLDYQREFIMMRDTLLGWYCACNVDVTMEGPVVTSIKRNQLQKLFMDTCKAIEETE